MNITTLPTDSGTDEYFWVREDVAANPKAPRHLLIQILQECVYGIEYDEILELLYNNPALPEFARAVIETKWPGWTPQWPG